MTKCSHTHTQQVQHNKKDEICDIFMPIILMVEKMFTRRKNGSREKYWQQQQQLAEKKCFVLSLALLALIKCLQSSLNLCVCVSEWLGG